MAVRNLQISAICNKPSPFVVTMQTPLLYGPFQNSAPPSGLLPVPSPLEYSSTGSLVLSARYMAEKRATAAVKQVAALYEASDGAARDYISRKHN